MFDLLEVEQNCEISLTENYAMYPAASVAGYYFSHPFANYFQVGKIGKDQVMDYAERKSISFDDCRKIACNFIKLLSTKIMKVTEILEQYR